MPKLIPLYMLSAVVIAAAGSAAFAQSTGTRAAASSGASSTTLKSSVNPRTAAPPATGTSGTGGTGTGAGSTSGTGSTATTSTGSTTAGTGSTTGTTSGTGNGSTSRLGATGSPSVDATGTTDNTVVNAVTNPIFMNGAVGMPLLGSDVVSDENAALYSQNAQGTQISLANPATVSEPTAGDVSRAGASLDRVINQASRERRKIGRNGQLLNSITPRTSVDRSNEMPDDGPTPALKGLLSR